MKTQLFVSFIALLLFTSCDRYFYAPNKVNVPGLRQAGDMRIEGGIGGGFIAENAELQASYAIAPFLGIMANGAFNRNQGEQPFDSNRKRATDGRFGEVGLGYFRELQTNPDWLFEIYGGVGTGRYNLTEDGNPSYTLQNKRFFVQPSMMYTTPSQKIELAIASRLSVLDYSGNTVPIGAGTYMSKELIELLGDSPKALWEPSFRFSVGSPVTKFYVSVTPSLLLSRYFESRELFNFNTGVRFNFNTRKPKRQTF